MKLATGLDKIGRGDLGWLKSYRLGLLANQASVDGGLIPARELISEVFPGRLRALFGPQHGYGGQDQDNMVETEHGYDNTLGIPIFSLYAEAREPLPHMLGLLDVLVVDLQDVGTRVYTFASTLLQCLKSASREGKKVVVLDRPNPLGGEVMEGNTLKPELYSFVGPYALPMRHGLTMGELALLFKKVYRLDCELDVVTVEGWKRGMLWGETGLRWIMPSPNMPVVQTAMVYPGQVLWEGTNLSEGRGTCRPFEIFGAPFVDPAAVKSALDTEAAAGCRLQDFAFRPTFGKWQGELCRGFMIHVLDPRVYRPYAASTALLKSVMEVHQGEFEWRSPPYEYEMEKMPIDLIAGDSSFRENLESGASLGCLRSGWEADAEGFGRLRKPFLLYL